MRPHVATMLAIWPVRRTAFRYDAAAGCHAHPDRNGRARTSACAARHPSDGGSIFIRRMIASERARRGSCVCRSPARRDSGAGRAAAVAVSRTSRYARIVTAIRGHPRSPSGKQINDDSRRLFRPPFGFSAVAYRINLSQRGYAGPSSIAPDIHRPSRTTARKGLHQSTAVTITANRLNDDDIRASGRHLNDLG